MKTKDVAKLSPLERFLYWIKERHSIYLKKEAGEPKPWTDDEVLQKFFFTNPYRENDKVTKWFRETIREPLRDNPDVLMATIIFRWFNYIPTGEILWNYGSDQEGVADLLTRWNSKLALAELRPIRDRGEQIFTGAFMINSPAGEPKLEAICRRIDNVWKKRAKLLEDIKLSGTLQTAHWYLTCFDGLGGFMAYEIVCDLRYTYLLEDATDKLTWCNPGPGCIRGIYRITETPFKKGDNWTALPKPKGWLNTMQKLLATVQRRLPKMPTFELREIEHSLCEWDKYERATAGPSEGRMKRRYDGAEGDAT